MGPCLARGGCNLLRPLPFCSHCSSHMTVSGQAKPTGASGPPPGPSSPGVPGSLIYSHSPSSGLPLQQGYRGPHHLKEQSRLTPSLLSLFFFPRLGAKHHQTRCHQMLVPPTYLPTYHASINLLTVQPLPSLGVTVGLPFTHHSKLDPGRGPSTQSVLSRQQESALLLLAFILIITSPTQRWDA